MDGLFFYLQYIVLIVKQNTSENKEIKYFLLRNTFLQLGMCLLELSCYCNVQNNQNLEYHHVHTVIIIFISIINGVILR